MIILSCKVSQFLLLKINPLTCFPQTVSRVHMHECLMKHIPLHETSLVVRKEQFLESDHFSVPLIIFKRIIFTFTVHV